MGRHTHVWELNGQHVRAAHRAWLTVLYYKAPRLVGVGLRFNYSHRQVYGVLFAQDVGALGNGLTSHRLTPGSSQALGHKHTATGPEAALVETFVPQPHEHELATYDTAGAPVVVVGLHVQWAFTPPEATADPPLLALHTNPVLWVAGYPAGLVSRCTRCGLQRQPDPGQPRTGPEAEGVRWLYRPDRWVGPGYDDLAVAALRPALQPVYANGYQLLPAEPPCYSFTSGAIGPTEV